MHKLLRSDSGCKGMGPSCKVWPWGDRIKQLRIFCPRNKIWSNWQTSIFLALLQSSMLQLYEVLQKSKSLKTWKADTYPWHWEWETRGTCSLRLHADWISIWWVAQTYWGGLSSLQMRSDSASVSRFSGSLLQSFRAREAFSIRCNGRPWSVWLRAFLCFCYLSKRSQKLDSSDIPVEFEELHFYDFFANVSRKEGIPEQDQEVALQRALRCLGSPGLGPSSWVQKIQQVARLFRQLVQWYWARFPVATRDPIHSITLLPSWNFGPSCLRAWYFTGVLSSLWGHILSGVFCSKFLNSPPAFVERSPEVPATGDLRNVAVAFLAALLAFVSWPKLWFPNHVLAWREHRIFAIWPNWQALSIWLMMPTSFNTCMEPEMRSTRAPVSCRAAETNSAFSQALKVFQAGQAWLEVYWVLSSPAETSSKHEWHSPLAYLQRATCAVTS